MADAGTLFDLAARISVDTSKSDKALTDTQRKVLGLTDNLKVLDRSTGTTGAGLGNLGTKGTVAGAGILSAATAIPVLTGAATIGAAAIGTLITQFLSLVQHSANVAGNLKDMSDKTNFAVETLSTLQVAGKRADVDLSALSASLIIFQKNQGAAAAGSGALSKTFKDLNIDLRDNEKGLREAFQALHKMGEGQRQTEVGAKLFGRGIANVQAILKETNGDIDEAMKRYSKLGLIISTETALAADAFSDTLQTVQDQIDATSRAIVSKSLPSFTVFFEDISRTLGASANEWMFWADVVKGSVAGVLGGIQGLVEYIASRGTLTLSIAIDSSIRSNIQRAEQAEAFNAMEAATGRVSRMAGAGRIGGGGGGGGKGGGGAKKDVLQGLKDALNGLNAEYRKYNVALFDSANYSALAAEKEKLLSSVMSSLNATTKARVAALRDVDQALEAAIGALPKKSQEAANALVKQALAQFESNEQLRIAGELNKQVDEVMKQWKRDIDNTIAGADEFTITIQRLEDAFAEYGKTLSGVDRIELNHLANLQRMIALGRKASESARQLFEHGVSGPAGALFAGGPTNDLGNTWEQFRLALQRPGDKPLGTFEAEVSAAIERAMGGQLPPPDMSEFRARMRELGADLTNVLDQSIRVGFERGIKAGFASLLQGLLQMINEIFLKRLAEGISDILIGLGSGGKSSGGGWLTALKAMIGIGAGAAGGLGAGAAGASSGSAFGSAMGGFAGMFAQGGYMPANQWGIVGEHGPEFVRAGKSGATVAPMGGNVTVIFQVQDARALQSRDTQSQVARTYQRVLQKRALTG